MAVGYQKKQNEAVTMWWLHIRREYVHIFQIMLSYPKGMNQLQALQANKVIRRAYTMLIMEQAPEDCHLIWKSFSSMLLNLIKATEALSEKRAFESRIFYDSANVDYTEMQFHLLQNGVFQPSLGEE